MNKNENSLAKLIAKDVLLQLNADKFLPTTGTYLRTSLDFPGEDINHVVKRKCEVCAQGAIFVSLVNRFGYHENKAIMRYYGRDLFYAQPNRLQRYLKKYFDEVTLNHIEAAFELWDTNRQLDEQYENGRLDYPDDLVNFREVYDYTDSTPTERMISIMVQIIMDDGEFNHIEYLNRIKKYGYEWYLEKVDNYV